ncbi:MAG: pantetheine-phosphate adenylyltransferase [Bacteroidota bacterium]|nr:pantetheine-phosphate adenylyltransferase [Bacteroidota bacterium]
MEKIAVFPGSFDPITRGHESIVHRGLSLFDRIIVALGENPDKKGYFPIDQRIKWLEEVFQNEKRVQIKVYHGLTVNFCNEVNASYILRGLRTAADFEFERGIGQMNKVIAPSVETVFILSYPEYSAISSSIVRDIHRHGGDISAFIPTSLKIS